MKYIIMCGGKYQWEDRQLSKINGEELTARTIRLLRENGIEDICISTSNPAFKKYGVPILTHDNSYRYNPKTGAMDGYWCDAFFPTDEPTCYLFGDVFFSEQAIKTIIDTNTDDIEFFASTPNNNNEKYIKQHVEPFALKVVNTNHLKAAVLKAKELEDENMFWRKPIMWELWTVIKGLPLQTKPDEYDYNSYVAINDETCDIDRPGDLEQLRIIERR